MDIANALHLEAGRRHTSPFSALVTTPMPSLKSLDLSAVVYSVLTVDKLRFAATWYLGVIDLLAYCTIHLNTVKNQTKLS